MSKEDALNLLGYYPAFAAWKPVLTLRGVRLSEDAVWRVIRRLAGNGVQRNRKPQSGERLLDGCIEWDASTTQDGYGRMNIWVPGIGRVQQYVHRLSWQLAHGRVIAEGKEIDHLCDCAACFNPQHIKAETLRNNRQRAAWNTNAKRR